MSSERPPLFPNGLYVERRANGRLLSKLCGKLAVLAEARDDIDLRSPEVNGLSSTRVEQVRKEESLRPANIEALREANLSRREILRRLGNAVPSLLEERPVIATALDRYENIKGETFLSLIFRQRDNDANGNERADTWTALEGITGRKLKWGYEDPYMRIMYAGETVPGRAVDAIADIFRGALRDPEPFAVTLLPAIKREWLG